jgi:RNA polymerase sigma factor (TIGR02999 family)
LEFSAFSRVALSREPFPTVSELLERWRAGDQQALETLVPLVYNELRGLAHYHLRRERPGHTLQTTALVNEAYVRLARGRPFEAENRTHFVAIAARVMRQILVDYARNRGAAKRGTDRLVELNGIEDDPADRRGKPLAREVPSLDLVRLDDALRELARIDEQQSRLVELRFFGGLTVEEAAEVLRISRSTAKRDWNVAKAWLSRQLKRGTHGEERKLAKD